MSFGIPCLATDLCLTPNDIFLGPLKVISIPRNGGPRNGALKTYSLFQFLYWGLFIATQCKVCVYRFMLVLTN